MDLLKESDKVILFNVEKSGDSLGEFLSKHQVSRRLFRKLYKEKNIYVNGEFRRKDEILEKGDLVSIVIVDEEDDTIPEPIPLNIIYEDMDLLVLDKQPYMVVHPTKGHQTNTIANGISYYFKSKGINRRIRFVNRLDMNTSGILIVAKSSFAHQQMALQFENNQVEKRYMAVVAGVVEKDEDIINLPLGREEERSIIKTVTKDGKDAITKYRVLERFKDASLLDVQIFTGRSHQIRVHLNHIGHPIIGDTLYYKSSEYIERQALHSYYLKAKLPRSREEIEFKASLPQDMERLINILKDQK